MSGLRDYLKSKGARTLTEENCPALAKYRRTMREEVIPAIERDVKARRRAAHFARLGIPDPLASADTLPKGQDAKQGLAGTESGAVASASPTTDARTAPDTSHKRMGE